ncbi:MAG TPA: hypothetical protein PLH65_02705 [bacterium]|nr:hypothetical protein [bacterium]HPN67382.1 hypothetical protein [bacterium]
MLTFFNWYYRDQTKNIYQVFVGLWSLIASYFDIQMMIKHLGEPLYQDYSYSGRAIGFLIRLGRIILGVFLQIILAIILGILLLLWVLLPLIISVKIIYISATMW